MAKVPEARPDKIELVPDAWERFRSAVNCMMKSGPRHRPSKKPKRKPSRAKSASRKPRKTA